MKDRLMPQFSIVIPTYNRAKALERCLESLCEQTFKDFEVLVCDDGSKDATSEVIGKYAKRLSLQHLYEDNWGGPARPRNRGIITAEAPWVCFLDSDDWFYPHKLEAVIKIITDKPQLDVLFHDLDIHGSKGIIKKNSYGKDLKSPAFKNLLYCSNVIHNSSSVVRKSKLEDVCGVLEDKSIIAAEDFDLWLRLAKVTDQFYRIPQTLGAYWVGDDSISKASELQTLRVREVFDRHIVDLPETERAEAYAMQNYVLGSLKFNLGFFWEAKSHFQNSLAAKGFEYRLKSLYWLISCQWKLAKTKNQRKSTKEPKDVGL